MVEAEASVKTTGYGSIGVEVRGLPAGAGSGAQAEAIIDGVVSAPDEFGIGVAVRADGRTASLSIGPQARIDGGWQAVPTDTSTTHGFAAAGVAIGSEADALVDNSGRIGASSDRAVADIARYTGGTGNLVLNNRGEITGFIELAGGQSSVVNEAGGVFELRHFADTDGDGERDTRRVAVSDLGGANSSFDNRAGAMVRLAPVQGYATTDPANYYVPETAALPQAVSIYDLARDGIGQAQLTGLGVFSNAGVIDIRGPEIGNTLIITSNAAAGGVPGAGVYVSNGGQLLLNVAFNTDSAAAGPGYADVLVIDGAELGSAPTTVIIDRREGVGEQAPDNDILLVEVRDAAASSADAFVLQGDYEIDGEQRILGGLYSYALQHLADDGNWYLRSVAFSPTVPVYQEYPKFLVPLVDLSPRQYRGGNRYWRDPAAPVPIPTVFCKDASQNYRCAITREQAEYYLEDDGSVVIDDSDVWVRIDGSKGHYEAEDATIAAEYDLRTWLLHVGVDRLLSSSRRGRLVAGVSAHYGDVSGDVTSTAGSGDIDLEGYGVGASLTWYGLSGLYVDGQARATWLSSDLGSATLGTSLADGNEGFGYALGIEIGRSFALSEKWSLIPQAQLVYLRIDFDDFVDPYGNQVSLRDGDSLRGRLGLAAARDSRWLAANGTVSRTSLYAVANLYNEFLNGYEVAISGSEVTSRTERLWGGIGAGFTYAWRDGKYAIFGEASVNAALERRDSHMVAGNLGLRISL